MSSHTKAIRDIVAPTLIGSWVSCLLYSLEVVQAFLYFRSASEDPILLRCAVALAVAADTLGIAAGNAVVYQLAITGWGDFASLAPQGWPYPTAILTSGISSTVCEGYLLYRYFRLTKHYWVVIPIAAVIVLAEVCSLILTYDTAQLKAFTGQTGKGLSAASIRSIIWLASKTVADIVIALALIIKLAQYARDGQTLRHMRTKLYRLMFIAAQSGLAPLLVSLPALVIFFRLPMTNISFGMAFCIGRLYTLTLLLNLTLRSSASTPTANAASSRSGGVMTNASTSKPIGLHTFFVEPSRARYTRNQSRSGRGNVTVLAEAEPPADTDIERSAFPYERETIVDLGEEDRDPIAISLPAMVNNPDQKIF